MRVLDDQRHCACGEEIVLLERLEYDEQQANTAIAEQLGPGITITEYNNAMKALNDLSS